MEEIWDQGHRPLLEGTWDKAARQEVTSYRDPSPCGQTNTCEDITLPQTSRGVKILRNRADIESNGSNGSRKRKTQGVPRLFRLLNGVLYSYLYKVSLTCGKRSRILPIMHFCFPGFKGMGLIIPKLRLGQSVCPPWHHIVGLFRNM